MQEVLNIHETAGLLNRGMVYRTFPEVLKDVQEYISKNFASVLRDNPDENRELIESYIGKYLEQGGVGVEGMDQQELCELLYGEMTGGHTVGKAHGEQVQHLRRGRPETHELFFRQFPGIDDTDGNRQPLFPVNHAVPHDRDADLVVQVPHHNGLRIVKYHARLVQKSPDHVHRMAGAVEMLLCRDDLPGGISDLHIPPLIDIDFLHILPVQEGMDQQELCELLYGEMTGFSFLTRYLYREDGEEIKTLFSTFPFSSSAVRSNSRQPCSMVTMRLL